MKTNEFTDKIESGFLSTYAQLLAELPPDVKILELGVKDGGSLVLWKENRPAATVVGVDLEIPKIDVKAKGCHFYQGDQTDELLFKRIAHETGVSKFDLIIDDVSHIGHLTKKSFMILFLNYLKPGGTYVIEDWGTGYFYRDPFYKSDAHKYKPTLFERMAKRFYGEAYQWSHQFGCVGTVKTIIDLIGFGDASDPKRGYESANIGDHRIESLFVRNGMAVVKKKPQV